MSAVFHGLTPELKAAAQIIKDECARHEKFCTGCPFFINAGTIHQRCGLNVYEGNRCDYPSAWEFDDTEEAPEKERKKT